MKLSAPTRYQNPLSQSGVIERASAATGFDVEYILGANRWQVLCEVRWAIALVLRRNGMTLPAIGRLLRRDHSTIINGLQQAEKLHAAGGDFAKLVEVISQ